MLLKSGKWRLLRSWMLRQVFRMLKGLPRHRRFKHLRRVLRTSWGLGTLPAATGAFAHALVGLYAVLSSRSPCPCLPPVHACTRAVALRACAACCHVRVMCVTLCAQRCRAGGEGAGLRCHHRRLRSILPSTVCRRTASNAQLRTRSLRACSRMPLPLLRMPSRMAACARPKVKRRAYTGRERESERASER
eukprot:648562-Pleurochrysis_carterae.AAC.1